MNRLLAQLLALLTAISTLFSATAPAAPCGTWQPGSGGNGVTSNDNSNAYIAAVTMWDPDGPGPRPRALVAAGYFTTSGGEPASNIALWNGTRWEPLGSGVNGPINSLAVRANGDLIVAGSFSAAGGQPARNLAAFNGTMWSECAGGANNVINCVACGTDGSVYITGLFSAAGNLTAQRVARHDGTQWHAMGAGLNGEGYFIHIAPDQSVYVTGSFSRAGGLVAQGLAKWSDGQWSGFPSTPGFERYCVHIRINGDLVLGGQKNALGPGGTTIRAPFAAVYSNNTWTEVAGIPQIADGHISCILEKQGTLTLMGKIVHSAGSCATYQQNGSAWNLVNAHLDEAWSALWDDAGKLVYGGRFTTPTLPAVKTFNHIVAFDGTTPSSFSHGIDGPVLSITTNDQQTVLGGSFISADGVRLNGVCRWNGSGFESIGLGLVGQVQAVKILPDQSILAGRLATPGTVGSTLSRWDGQSWSNVGGAMSGSVHAVTALANGDIIVGGEPMAVGALSLNRIGRYSQGTWSNMGTGMNGTVRGLTTLSDQSVIACGDFSTAGGALAFRIARWSNNTWRPFGGGLGGSVACTIQDSDGSIIAAGAFIQAIDSTTVLRNVGRWDGAAWRAMGLGLFGQVHSLTKRGNTIIAAGSFSLDGGPANLQLAQWTGTDWAPVGGPALDNAIRAVAIAPNGDLIAGGAFLRAGSIPTANFAHMKFCIAEFNCDGTTDFFDYLDFVAAFAISDPRTDLNADSTIDLFDYLDFLEHFNVGC